MYNEQIWSKEWEIEMKRLIFFEMEIEVSREIQVSHDMVIFAFHLWLENMNYFLPKLHNNHQNKELNDVEILIRNIDIYGPLPWQVFSFSHVRLRFNNARPWLQQPYFVGGVVYGWTHELLHAPQTVGFRHIFLDLAMFYASLLKLLDVHCNNMDRLSD